MMTTTFLNPESLGQAIAPYSQAVVVDRCIHVAGQVALGPDGETVGTTIEEQVHCVLDRLTTILAEAGAGLENVVKATVYLTDRANYSGLNEAWTQRFGAHHPVRSLVVADLVRPGLLVEIVSMAVLPD